MEFRGPIERATRPRPAPATRRGRARLGPLARAAGVRAATAPAITTGRDVTTREIPRERRPVSRGAWLAIAGGGLLAALMLVQLRTESIDLRYRLASSLKTEQRLLEEQRRLIVELRQLRHPVRLAELGAELGLARPQGLRELPASSLRP